MFTITELREQQARIHTNARAKIEEITTATPEDRAAEINTEFDRMMTEYDAKQGQIDRLERLVKLDRQVKRPDPRRPGAGAQADGDDGADAPTYREAFAEFIRAGGVQADMRPEARDVLRSGFAPVEKRAQLAGTTTAGGFTVPTELQAILVKSMVAWGPMYDEDICTTITTASGNPLPLPTIDDTTKTLSVTAEGVTLADTGAKDAVFGQRQLDAFSYNTEWIRVSYELANDSIFNMEQLLGDLLGERLGRRANQELTVGDGTGDPNGIVTAATLGVTAASATAITWDEVMGLEHSVDPAYRQSPKCRYMFHDNILLALRRLKDGQGNYLWQMGDVKGGYPDTFNGRKYSINQAMAGTQATTARVVLFGDFSKYYVRKVGAPIIGAIQDKDFWPGFGIAGYIRIDGELVDTAAVKYLRNL
jgi:HK97 family phage major capsid protein